MGFFESKRKREQILMLFRVPVFVDGLGRTQWTGSAENGIRKIFLTIVDIGLSNCYDYITYRALNGSNQGISGRETAAG